MSLVACQQQSDLVTESKQQGVPALLEVGERRVTLDQFRREATMNYPEIASLLPSEQQVLLRQLINQLIDRELIFAEAQRLQIQISEDEFEAALSAVRGEYTAGEFEKVLQRTGRTPDFMRNALKLQLLTAKLTDAIIAPQIEVTEQEMVDYYHEHQEDYRRPAEVRAHQMLFQTYETAMEIKNRLQEGEEFATLARQYSISPDREDGGMFGYFSEGYLPPEFDAVIFQLPLHEISDPVESPYGYHLFMVDHKRGAGLRPFVVVNEEIADLLYQTKEEAAFQQWLKNLRDSTQTRIDWSQVDAAIHR